MLNCLLENSINLSFIQLNTEEGMLSSTLLLNRYNPINWEFLVHNSNEMFPVNLMFLSYKYRQFVHFDKEEGNWLVRFLFNRSINLTRIRNLGC